MIRKMLISLATIAVMTCACGAPPEPVAASQSALIGSSVPPAAYNWNSYSQPWVCAGAVGSHPTWNPMVSPLPMNNTNSWCQWMPATSTSLLPWNTDECWPGGTPSGAIDIYSNTNLTGSCARLYGLGAPVYGLGHTAPFTWNADLMEVNGWHSTWIPTGGTPQFAGVKSVSIGPYTAATFCAGPITGPEGAPCQYHQIGVGTFGAGVSYQGMIDPAGGLFFETAAIKVWATQ